MTFACFQMEEKKKRQQQPVRTDYWLQPNIVVKVITKKLGEQYHKRKAVVMARPRFPFEFPDEGTIIFISFTFRSEFPYIMRWKVTELLQTRVKK